MVQKQQKIYMVVKDGLHILQPIHGDIQLYQVVFFGDYSRLHLLGLPLIYGHNMKNLSMFGKLKYYNRDENYYDSHQYFQILVDGKKYRYQIFSYETVSDDSDEYTVGFEPDETFGKFVQRMAASSMKDTGIVPTKDDKVVTLSTCSTSGETYRFVVHGVRVDEH